jgi:hypothetical protein
MRITGGRRATARKNLLGSALLAFASVMCLVACGSGTQAPEEMVAPGSVWLGQVDSFCQGRWTAPTEVRGAGARLVLGGLDPQLSDGLYLRVENVGEEDLSFGLPPVIEKNVNGRWIPQSFADKNEAVAFSLRVWGAEVGTVSRCVRVPIPRGWGSGQYRLRMLVNRTDDPAEPPELLPASVFRLPARGER